MFSALGASSRIALRFVPSALPSTARMATSQASRPSVAKTVKKASSRLSRFELVTRGDRSSGHLRNRSFVVLTHLPDIEQVPTEVYPLIALVCIVSSYGISNSVYTLGKGDVSQIADGLRTLRIKADVCLAGTTASSFT